MKCHQPRLRVMVWVRLSYESFLVRLDFPQADWRL
jgi:hypothetical protein